MMFSRMAHLLNKFSRRLKIGYCFTPPDVLELEHTNRCNLRCRSCARFFFAGQFEDMKPEILEKVKREIVPLTRGVWLSGYGEPLMNRAFSGLLDYMLSLKKKVSFITNGTLLNDDMIERVFRGGCDVYLSIDGATNETMRYLRGIDLDPLVKKMERLKDLRENAPANGFHLFVILVLSRRNIEEIPDLIRILARCRVDQLILQDAIFVDRNDDIVREKLVHHKEITRGMFPVIRRAAEECNLPLRIPSFPWLEESSGETSIPISPSSAEAPLPKCFRPWSEVYVDVYGNVKGCCSGGAASLGNLRTESFRGIWNGRSFRNLRNTVNTPAMPEYCRTCEMR